MLIVLFLGLSIIIIKVKLSIYKCLYVDKLKFVCVFILQEGWEGTWDDISYILIFRTGCGSMFCLHKTIESYNWIWAEN